MSKSVPPQRPDEPVGADASKARDPSDGMAALEERIERLERLVDRLVGERPEAALGESAEARVPPAAEPERPPPPPVEPSFPSASHRAPAWSHSTPRREARVLADWMRLGEDWVGRVGMVLLFLGVAFLYNYAVQQGWITPWLRVAFGAGLGSALLLLGLRWAPDRPLYSQVLLGGAVAVLYLTGWAAQMLYTLVPLSVGFSFMATVTVLALVLAERKEHQTLAVIGAAGGLVTPFVLSSVGDQVMPVVVYWSLVLAWAGHLQLRRGWGVLLTVNAIGGMAVMGFVADGTVDSERWIAQSGILLAWVVACPLPYLQALRHLREPEAWPPSPGSWPPEAGTAGPRRPNPGLFWVLALVPSAAAVLFGMTLWNLDRAPTGVGFLLAAAVLLAGAAYLRPWRGLWHPAVEAGGTLLLLGTALVFAPRWVALPLALEATAFLWFAQRDEGKALRTMAYLVFGFIAFAYGLQLSEALNSGAAPERALAISMLGAIAAAVASGTSFVDEEDHQMGFLVLAYAAFLAWLAWVLTPLPGGRGVTSTSWVMCGLVLLWGSRRGEGASLRMAALATLGAVATKLLLVDLRALDAGLRIVLFLGFGAVFLVLGRTLQGGDAASEGEGREDPAEP